jgi:hypothetical protein
MKRVHIAFVTGLLLIASSGPIAASAAGERIVLRDLRVIRAAPESFDEDGLVLVDAEGQRRVLDWGEVESIELDNADQQKAAEALLKQLGDPLYRLRVRLTIGDDEGLLEPAEALKTTFRDRRSPAAYLVLQSVVWGRIAHARREEAVEPWLRAYELLRSRVAKLSDLPGERHPRAEASTAWLGELEPVWFDAAAAAKALPAVEAQLKRTESTAPSGANLYAASLAIAAGSLDRAAELLAEPPTEPTSVAIRQVLLAELDLARKNPDAAVSRLVNGSAGPADEAVKNERWLPIRALELYALGRAQLAATDEAKREAGLLTLLRIPALQSENSPELSAAALAVIAEHYAGDKSLARRLQAEIRRKFAGTWHARRLEAAAEASPR